MVHVHDKLQVPSDIYFIFSDILNSAVSSKFCSKKCSHLKTWDLARRRGTRHTLHQCYDDDDDDDNNNAMKVHRKRGDKFPHNLDFGVRWE
jgi:hypothetical protein